MQCHQDYTDYLVQCPDGIVVNAVGQAGPYSATRWQITDKFGNTYEGDVLTNGNGGFTIPLNELPAGLLTQYSGSFSLRILDTDNDCRPVPILAAGYYDSITFSIKGGTAVKENLGCAFDMALGGSYAGLTNNYYIGDESQTVYTTATAFAPGSEFVYVGGLLYSTEQYTVTGSNQITFIDPPQQDAQIRIAY